MVYKRDGQIQEFRPEKIENAVLKAFYDVEKEETEYLKQLEKEEEKPDRLSRCGGCDGCVWRGRRRAGDCRAAVNDGKSLFVAAAGFGDDLCRYLG